MSHRGYVNTSGVKEAVLEVLGTTSTTSTTTSASTTTTTTVAPYKIYRAILNQTGVAAPTAVVLQNTIGTITYQYGSLGNYYIQSASSAFLANKTFVLIMSRNGNEQRIYARRISDGTIAIMCRNFAASDFADDVLENTSIEILIYP